MIGEKRILFKNLHIIDLDSDSVNYNAVILAEGRKIVKINKIPNIVYDDVIDCRGMYAVPSLIDMHVHITFNAFVDGEMSLNNVALNLALAARNGVCIVRDVGMHPKWSIEEVYKVIPKHPFPEIIFSGAPICIPEGHGWEYGQYIDCSAIDRYMDAHKKSGFEWIKIMNDPENHPLLYLNNLVHSAHEHGLKVACHVFRPKGLELAANAGCDTIEHVVPISNDNKVYCTPYYVPTAYSAWISCDNRYLNTIPEQDAQYLIEWYGLIRDYTADAISTGTKILCGTDAGCCPSSFGDMIPEILTLNMFGMSPIDVLRGATIEPARCLNRNDLYGSIEEGKYANFFFVDENPLRNLKTLLNKRIVVLFGDVIYNEVKKPWT